jgi:hypothetical protein
LPRPERDHARCNVGQGITPRNGGLKRNLHCSHVAAQESVCGP